MGGKKKKKTKKKKTAVQKAAAARHAKFKQTKVQTFGGKRTSFSKSEEKRIKDAGYSVAGYSKAAPNKASGYSGTSGVSVGSTIKNPNPPKSAVKQTSGIGPVADGSKYAESLSTATNQPTKTTTGIGPYADGAKYAEALKASPPVQKPTTKSGMLTSDQNVAMLPGEDNLGGPAAILGGLLTIGGMGVNTIKNIKDNLAPKLRENLEKKLNPDADKLTFAGDLSGLSISPTTTGPNYFSIKSPETFGAPSQAEVDKAAGITAGGLNIGGGGFIPKNPSGGTTSRAIRDMTSEQLADRYEASLNPDSFKGLSDGETRGVGPVASGRAYAAGLNVDNKNVENRIRSAFNAIPLVPNVRRLTDKEIADNRISAQKKLAYRKEMAKFKGGGGGGGARLPVAPLTPEEILLPEETAVAQTGPDYQQAVGQTGVDPNRLMQIQQEAYAQAFNPYNPMTVGGFNPMFRFFGRRAGGMGRGAFRRAFRRD